MRRSSRHVYFRRRHEGSEVKSLPSFFVFFVVSCPVRSLRSLRPLRLILRFRIFFVCDLAALEPEQSHDNFMQVHLRFFSVNSVGSCLKSRSVLCIGFVEQEVTEKTEVFENTFSVFSVGSCWQLHGYLSVRSKFFRRRAVRK